MAVIRLILLVAVLGGLMLLLAQNWSPAIPLVFLGLRTQPLSLAVWMLLSTAAGALTSLLMSSLVKLSSRGTRQQRQTSSYEPFDSPRVNKRTPQEKASKEKAFKEEQFKERISTPPPASPQSSDQFEDSDDDDWDLDRNVNDDWDSQEREYVEEKEYITSNSRSSYTKIQDDRDYEDFEEPENDYDSADSSYSYEKSDLKDSRAEKTEVYDADYRVIVPPPTQSTVSGTSDKSNDKGNDDDWDFLEEDFSEDKPQR
ncbi:LapA family protein [Calothrix sp. CCY 0018]|uniref:LapA family protein n=1 Tax=Calothrix sp. CCY 0018 TaxID=3103864 RepID=UPI0039C65028